MTARQIACKVQSQICRMPDSYQCDIERAEKEGNIPMVKVWTDMWQENIRAAYVLGLMIDAMPVELAEREI
jgi:hypothetical protein